MMMIYMWMKRNLNLLSRSMLRFIDFAICRAIVYFIACFFARDEEEDRSTSNLVYHSSLVNSKKDKDSRNHMSQEKAASSPCLDKERFDLNSIHIDKGFREELFLRREYCNEDIRVLNDRTPAITPCSRPNIGSIASHWDENEQTEISHKEWGGNGIPNTTTKYKEDQKVSWHATPFKVRLDKALSEEDGQGFVPLKET